MKAAVVPAPVGALGGRERERFPWFLFLCVVLSFCAHAGSFLIFQVIYPQHVSVPPPPPEVHLLSPASPQYAAIVSWIDAEDPALVASAPSVQPAGLLEVSYRPSYSVQRTAPRSVPEASSAVQFPAAMNPLSIIRSADAPPPVSTPAPEPLTTRVTFSPALAAIPLVTAPQFGSTHSTPTPVEPSRYLIGVADRGEVRFVFLQQSSGNSELDAIGARGLAAAMFAAPQQTVIWSHATVAWGNEVWAAGAPSNPAADPKPE